MAISLSDKDFANECLERHNFYRRKHGVPSLKMSKMLCDHAQEWTQVLSKEGKMRHRPDSVYGENIYMAWHSDPNHKIPANEAVDGWYDEIKQYNFGTGGYSVKTGHFTQLVWKDSKKFGVAITKTGNGFIYLVAYYNPPGNVQGEYETNVPPPKKIRASR